MPFTFSHPAIVLPFANSKRKLFSLTGLVMGSIAPDIEFLMQLKETNNFAHTWPWVILFNIPVTILLAFVFHEIIRNTLILHLPKYLQQRFYKFIFFNWPGYFNQNKLKFLLSAFIGIVSHIFLDAFTHHDGTFVKMYSFFYQQITILQYSLPVFFLLQMGTSLLGGFYILWIIFKMKKENQWQEEKPILGYWLSLVITACCVFIVRLILDKAHQSVADIVVAFFGSMLYALLIISLYYLIKKDNNIKRSPVM